MNRNKYVSFCSLEGCQNLLKNRKNKFCCLSHANKGRKITEETREKMRKAHSGKNNGMYGKKHSTKTRQILSKQKQGSNHPRYGKFGKDNPMYGFRHTEETKKKIKDKITKLHNDVDYRMVNLYTKNSDKYRKIAIDYYGAKCEWCGTDYNFLEVHHLDGNRSNNDISNLCVLCRDCHYTKAHIIIPSKQIHILNTTFKEMLDERRIRNGGM